MCLVHRGGYRGRSSLTDQLKNLITQIQNRTQAGKGGDRCFKRTTINRTFHETLKNKPKTNSEKIHRINRNSKSRITVTPNSTQLQETPTNPSWKPTTIEANFNVKSHKITKNKLTSNFHTDTKLNHTHKVIFKKIKAQTKQRNPKKHTGEDERNLFLPSRRSRQFQRNHFIFLHWACHFLSAPQFKQQFQDSIIHIPEKKKERKKDRAIIITINKWYRGRPRRKTKVERKKKLTPFSLCGFLCCNIVSRKKKKRHKKYDKEKQHENGLTRLLNHRFVRCFLSILVTFVRPRSNRMRTRVTILSSPVWY